MKPKTVHGSYSDILEEEAKRIKQLYRDSLSIDINWNEATAIAAQRSLENFWDEKKLKQTIAKLRGVL